MINLFRKLIGKKPRYRVKARERNWSIQKNMPAIGYCYACETALHGDEQCKHSVLFSKHNNS